MPTPKTIDLTEAQVADGVRRDEGHKVLPVEGRGAGHAWQPAPPGQGSRQQTCKRCGQRLTVVGRNSACPGRHPHAVSETISDYDPFA